MGVKMNVIQRWNMVSILPEKGGLHTQLIVQRLREKLLVSAEEMEELQMVTGVIHEECGSPVENRGDEDNPEYYCLVCNRVVTDTKGLADRTIWNQAADTGKIVDLKKAERGILIEVFNKLDKDDEITPQHVAVWTMLSEAYPKAFTAPDDEDEDEGEE